MDVVVDNADLMWAGLQLTLRLAALVIVLSTIIGIFVGIGLLYGNRVIRSILRVYVDVIRGLPILVVIFLIYYGLPALKLSIFGLSIPTEMGRFETAALAFTLFGAAHIGEIIRGALNAVPGGQMDAAKSIGLTFWARLRYILLPQSMPVILPPWTNTAAEIVKATSLVILVSMSDLMFATDKIAQRTGDMIPIYTVAAIIYFVICFSISRAGVYLSRHYQHGVAR